MIGSGRGLCAGLALALSRVEEIEDALWRKDREWIERDSILLEKRDGKMRFKMKGRAGCSTIWLAAVIQAAYREGYRDGYRTYEASGGSLHPKTLRRLENESWESSDTKTASPDLNRPHAVQ